jgi:hypothetical protein
MTSPPVIKKMQNKEPKEYIKSFQPHHWNATYLQKKWKLHHSSGIIMSPPALGECQRRRKYSKRSNHISAISFLS